MPTAQPIAPLPPPLYSDVPGTWAYDTMSRRVRTDILARVFRENDLQPDAVARLRALDEELAAAASTPLSALPDDGGPDVTVWNDHILADELANKRTWLSAPWVVAEFYFYRRIMSAIDYFRVPLDPFVVQKELGLSSAIDSIATLSDRVNAICAAVPTATRADRLNHLQTLVLTALWGNRMDLSIWPVGGGQSASPAPAATPGRAAEAFSSVLEAGQRMILANDMAALTAHVAALPTGAAAAPRVDIVVDNAGFELFCDLCLADYLATAGLASVVHVQLKAHPTFVSDAMAKDVRHTLDFLRNTRAPDGAPTAMSTLGARWAAHVDAGRWRLVEDFFWVQPQAMWDMPEPLRADLAAHSALTFVKGDANYRRLLGDRHWPLDTPFEHVVSYFPSPVCALRTLKGELGCGMSPEATGRAANEDDAWLVAGKYGVVQFCNTSVL